MLLSFDLVLVQLAGSIDRGKKNKKFNSIKKTKKKELLVVMYLPRWVCEVLFVLNLFESHFIIENDNIATLDKRRRKNECKNIHTKRIWFEYFCCCNICTNFLYSKSPQQENILNKHVYLFAKWTTGEILQIFDKTILYPVIAKRRRCTFEKKNSSFFGWSFVKEVWLFRIFPGIFLVISSSSRNSRVLAWIIILFLFINTYNYTVLHELVQQKKQEVYSHT